MDGYGYGATLKTALRMFDGASRQTGRTTRLVERARDGGCIVTVMAREADRIKGLLRLAEKPGVRVMIVDPASDPREARRGCGRVLFGHLWVMQHFEAALAWVERGFAGERVEPDLSARAAVRMERA